MGRRDNGRSSYVQSDTGPMVDIYLHGLHTAAVWITWALGALTPVVAVVALTWAAWQLVVRQLGPRLTSRRIWRRHRRWHGTRG